MPSDVWDSFWWNSCVFVKGVTVEVFVFGQCPCMLSLLSFRMMVSSTANSRFFPHFACGETLYFLYSAAFFVSSGSLSKRCERQNESFSPPKKDRPTSSSLYRVSFFRESVFGTPFFRQIFASELQFWGSPHWRFTEVSSWNLYEGKCLGTAGWKQRSFKESWTDLEVFFGQPCAIHKQQNIQKNRYCIYHLVFQLTCLTAFFCAVSYPFSS